MAVFKEMTTITGGNMSTVTNRLNVAKTATNETKTQLADESVVLDEKLKNTQVFNDLNEILAQMSALMIDNINEEKLTEYKSELNNILNDINNAEGRTTKVILKPIKESINNLSEEKEDDSSQAE